MLLQCSLFFGLLVKAMPFKESSENTKQIITEAALLLLQPICFIFIFEKHFEIKTLDNIGWGVVAIFGGLMFFHIAVMLKSICTNSTEYKIILVFSA